MKIVPVPVRADNYAYLLIDNSSETNTTAVVDPYDVAKVQAALEKEGIKQENVKAVITTHHHDDHAGGNKEFVSHWSVWREGREWLIVTFLVFDLIWCACDWTCLHRFRNTLA